MSVAAKIKRAAQLGFLAGELVKSAVSRNPHNPSRISDRMGSMHGLPQKIGQMLSLREFESADKVFTGLTQGRNTLPKERVFQELERALGGPLSRWFESIDGEGLSASLGQVHRARLRGGQEVAVKLQYPGIAEAVRQDLSMLGVLAMPMGGYRRGFDVSGYRREMGLRLEEELDYRKEAKRMREFTNLLSGAADIRIPQPIEELSGLTFLTTTWLENVPLEAALHWSEPARKSLGETLLRLFFMSIFKWRLLHADPHAGNYRFALENGRPILILLDFGCVKEIPRSFSRELRRLIEIANPQNSPVSNERLLQCYSALGFNRELLEPMKDKLLHLARALLAPFHSEQDFSIKDWNLSEDFTQILGDLKWNFRVAGSPELLYVMRAWQGLLCYLKALKVAVSWRTIYEEVTHGLPAVNLQPEAGPTLKVHTVKSNRLKIRVTENDSVKVELTFSAEAVERLYELVPENLQSRLLEKKVDVRNIARLATENGFPHGVLFEDEQGSKSVKVWLE